mgnify:CR=1 FL=1
MKRRTFLQFSAATMASMVAGAAGVAGWQPRANAATITKSFVITEGFVTQADGVDVYFRGFSNDSNSLNVPGDAMLVSEGDTVEITIENTLGTDHSFVIDDLDVDEFIPSGNTVSFSFTPDRPGSFLYYDGLDAPNNRLSGLHGAIAVMPNGSDDEVYPGSPTFKPGHQTFWVFNTIDPAWNTAFQNNDNPPDSFVPRYFTLNGLSGRPPGSVGYGDPTVDAMHDKRSAVYGRLGDRTVIRALNAGRAKHSIHIHANHMEWLSENSKPRDDIWLKDIVPLDADGGNVDVIFPFEPAPDSWPPMTQQTLQDAVDEGRDTAYPMHLHDEMTQTSGGGLYLFGALTDIFYEV